MFLVHLSLVCQIDEIDSKQHGSGYEITEIAEPIGSVLELLQSIIDPFYTSIANRTLKIHGNFINPIDNCFTGTRKLVLSCYKPMFKLAMTREPQSSFPI
jgi:hypothetical protein